MDGITSNDEQSCISRCLSCPVCDGSNLVRDETEETWQTTYYEVMCLDCGEIWCEVDFADDEDDTY